MIAYIINRSKRAKRLSMRVVDQEVVVTSPMRFPKREIDTFVSDHVSWIEKQLAKQQGVEVWRERMRYEAGGEFMFLGEWREFDFESKKSLHHWYIQQAEEILTDKTAQIAEQLGVFVAQVQIKKFKSRWGSCHQGGVIKYNWPLIQAPEKIIDYVVVHECAHLIEMNHSQAFWEIVESLCPTYKQRRKWLQDMTFKLGLL